MHSLSTNYNEDPFHSATAHSFSRLFFSFPASESCSPFTHAGILPPSEMHRYAARLPACLLARAHAFLVTKTAASIVVGDGLINSFVLVCQHMLRRTHMEWRAAGRGIGCVGRAAPLPRRATTAPRRRRIIGHNGVIHFCCLAPYLAVAGFEMWCPLRQLAPHK